MSQVGDLTCFALIGFRDGKWQIWSHYWLPSEGIKERSHADHAPYDSWAERGLIELTEGNVVAYPDVAKRLRQFFDKYNITKCAFDRWNWPQFRPWLKEAGFSEAELEQRFVPFSQNFEHISPALRVFEEALLSGNVAHGGDPVAGMCVANCTIITADGGARKPSKRKSTGRIDFVSAALMAFGIAPQQAPPIDISTLIV